MNSLISRSTVLVAVAIASLLAATPAGAQSDANAIVAAVTNFLDGIRTRDTSLMRSTVVPAATLVPVGGPTGMGAPSAIDGISKRTGKGTGPGTTNGSKRPRWRSTSSLPLSGRISVSRALAKPGSMSVGSTSSCFERGLTAGRSFK